MFTATPPVQGYLSYSIENIGLRVRVNGFNFHAMWFNFSLKSQPLRLDLSYIIVAFRMAFGTCAVLN